ncbi:hypothetical protein [Streptomyces sp. NPDC002491]
MLWVAVLLLPMLSVLLAVMDRLETRLLAPAPAHSHRRHASPRRRGLRLIRGGASDAPAAAAVAPGALSPEVPAPDALALGAPPEIPSPQIPATEVSAAGPVRPSEARAA